MKKTPSNKKISKRTILLASGATAATLLMAVPALAATNTTMPSGHHSGQGQYERFTHATSTQNAAFGVIAGINGSTITLSHHTRDGMSNVTITTTSATVYKKNGLIDTATDLAVGQRIVAMGVKDSAGNISDATSINIFVPRTRSS